MKFWLASGLKDGNLLVFMPSRETAPVADVELMVGISAPRGASLVTGPGNRRHPARPPVMARALPRGRDRWFESLYRSKRIGRSDVDWSSRAGVSGVARESQCFKHLERSCTPAGRSRRKSRGRLRFERQY